jgi:hypothetical protein
MPTIITPELRQSQPFDIRPGEQVTLHATGMQEGDQVVVELLALSRASAASDWCCQTGPQQAATTEATLLRCRNGARVLLTQAFPWVTLSSPQSVPLRVRVIADDLAQITVNSEKSPAAGAADCDCVEPYSASYPLPGGGFAFAQGDMRDPEAVVAVNPCNGAAPEMFIFPTPRPFATARVLDCDGEVVGYAANQSTSAIQVGNTVPCQG